MGNNATEGTHEDKPGRPSHLNLSAVMELHQRNLAAMMGSWLVVADGFTAIASKQRELAAAALGDMTEMMAGNRSAGKPQEAMARQFEFAKKTMEATAATARGIAEVIAKSGADAASVVRQRIGAEGAAWLSDPARGAKLSI